MSNRTPTDDNLPEALVDNRRRISLVWLIPLVAVFAAAWLGYHTLAQQGPLITISFLTAEGLEAGKTRVRFKDVDVGLVEAIELSGDLSRVQVRARLAGSVSDYLNDNTRFWVARPRLSATQVSGLNTLLGGSYIAVDLSTEGAPQDDFVGLESPPIVTATEPGRIFTLTADALGSLSVGSPLLYRGIEAGRVVGYQLREPRGVEIQVFVDAPHDGVVGTNTRFWNASGIGLSLDASGIRLDTQSFASVLLGGIAFGNPSGSDTGELAAEGTEFRLYANEQAAFERRYSVRETWQLAFAGSVRGLLPGAPVELRGIRIGEVLDVQLQLDAERRTANIPVTIAIEPDRLGIVDAGGQGAQPRDVDRALWDRLVHNGLRAQLKTGNLISGALYVDLDFYPEDGAREIAWNPGGIPELPTVPTPLDELRSLMTRLARLPLDRMGEDLSATLAALRDTMNATNGLLERLDRETASELSKTLQQTRNTLDSLERVLKPNSPLQAEAQKALQEFGSAARSFRIMADYLERHPEALIRGKGAISP